MNIICKVVFFVFSWLVLGTHQQDAEYPMDIKKIGHEVNWSPSTKLVGLPYANTTFLLKDIIMQDGLLFAYSAYFLSNKPVRFQVWRPVDVFLHKYKLMWEHRIVPDKWNMRVDTYVEDIPGAECLPVQNGDRLGIFIEAVPGSVSYKFNTNNPTALTHPLSANETFAKLHEIVKFDPLVFPYDYSVAAYIDTNLRRYRDNIYDCPQGQPPLTDIVTTTSQKPNIHVIGIGATGATGPKGGSGPVGPQGLPGIPGIPGVSHHPVPAVGSNNKDCGCCQDDNGMFKPHVVLIIVAWLTALTVINLCYLCIVCCRCTTSTTHYRAEQQNVQNSWTEKLNSTTTSSNMQEVNANGVKVSFTKVEKEITPSPIKHKSLENLKSLDFDA